jgi:curli production assembly/transport component CsgG
MQLTTLKRLSAFCVFMSVGLAGCADTGMMPPAMSPKPLLGAVTQSRTSLQNLPAPSTPTTVAVYQFADQTGQFKSNDSQNQSLSRALTQGADSLVVQALRDVGDGKWFNVVERAGLDDVLRERRIIQTTRNDYLNEQRINPDVLPPLVFAGAIIRGGVIGYDSNVLTGGMGARFLGIGGSTQYRESVITVALRLVSVKNGQVLASVTARKTLLSIGIQGGLTKFVSFKRLLEVEGGVTANEPALVALQQAIEHGVMALIVQGGRQKVWAFADPAAGEEVMAAFERENNIASLAIDGQSIEAEPANIIEPKQNQGTPGDPSQPPRAVDGCRRISCPEQKTEPVGANSSISRR